MKKWIVLLLLTIMLLPCACALAEGEFKVVDEVAFATENKHNGTPLICVFIEVENVSDREISLNYKSSFAIIDQDGNEHSEGAFISMYPQSLLPGEHGFVVPSTYALTGITSYDQVADYRYELVAGEPSYFTCEKYETSLETMDDRLLLKFTNPTDDTLYDASMVTVYRGAQGELLYVLFNYLYDYGIPSGMSAYVNVKLRDEVKDFFAANGLEATATESIGYKTTY